jgi:hypothetical protein
MDCLGGLQMAVRNKWVDYQGFDSCEWRRLLRTYDASFAFHLPHPAGGESRRLTFYAMADPVTTVADPSVRPKPPEDGFVGDYASMPRSRKMRSGKNGKPNPASFLSEPSRAQSLTPDAPVKTKSKGENSRHSDIPDDVGETQGSSTWNATMLLETRDERRDQVGSVKTKHSNRSNRSNDDMQLDSSNNSLATSLSLETASCGGMFEPPSAISSSPAHPEEVTWLEAVRVRRWGQEQHARQSTLPVAFIKERGLATLPEFGTWLRSVGCRRLVQLNFPNEPNLPPGGSYTDYFTQWQLQQEQLRFGDGTAPPPQVVQRFRSVVEQVLEDMSCDSPTTLGHDSAIVVHCTGGLGRTGSLLGALVIETLGVSGGDWIGWVRMCRPGSVQTLAQEAFLKTYVAPQEKTKQPGGCFCLFGARGSRSR